MNTATRRQFLLASGVTGGAALLAGATGVTWQQLMRHAVVAPLAGGTPILVVLTMYGGNDGLNTVIPYADPAYHDARPGLSYTADEVLTLDNQFGLNPAMTGMAKLWQRKKLAIVRGVGYPDPDLSHFRSMDIWQTASPKEPISTGWIGRWLDATGADPLRAVNIGAVLPPLAVGAKSAAAALPLGTSRPFPAPVAAAITALGHADRSDAATDTLVTSSCRAERQVAATFAPVLGHANSAPAGQPRSAAGSDLSRQLDLVARCITAGVPTRVYTVSQGGFDTHADEKGTQQDQLGVVDSAVAGFFTRMEHDPRGRDVVLLAYSEFGRRVHANASQGTDHGTAGPVFLAGSPVIGGFHSAEPSLTDLDNGNLKPTSDFRAIYAEVLAKVLGADPVHVLGNHPTPIGLLHA